MKISSSFGSGVEVESVGLGSVCGRDRMRVEVKARVKDCRAIVGIASWL